MNPSPPFTCPQKDYLHPSFCPTELCRYLYQSSYDIHRLHVFTPLPPPANSKQPEHIDYNLIKLCFTTSKVLIQDKNTPLRKTDTRSNTFDTVLLMLYLMSEFKLKSSRRSYRKEDKIRTGHYRQEREQGMQAGNHVHRE